MLRASLLRVSVEVTMMATVTQDPWQGSAIRVSPHAFVVVVGTTHSIGRRPILALALRELVCLRGQERGGIVPRKSRLRAAKNSSHTAASACVLAKK